MWALLRMCACVCAGQMLTLGVFLGPPASYFCDRSLIKPGTQLFKEACWAASSRDLLASLWAPQCFTLSFYLSSVNLNTGPHTCTPGRRFGEWEASSAAIRWFCIRHLEADWRWRLASRWLSNIGSSVVGRPTLMGESVLFRVTNGSGDSASGSVSSSWVTTSLECVCAGDIHLFKGRFA